ncbi:MULTISPECIES: hypothetical protein [Halorhodospira]|uniref:hypothetical protein n=1 Tax=Halorhodospira TaxID=85108 RepID=UPI001EE8C541|nr:MULTISPECIES: hypothetical protein [Halorhodospira]MCG5528647.1 hypothetical protein [Halorhodospira halophila]MCG5543974.1 hypothetical protein [Halorhodospira sp. 9628]
MKGKQLVQGGEEPRSSGLSGLLARLRSGRQAPRVGVQILRTGQVTLAACSPDGERLLGCERRTCGPEQVGDTLAAMVEAHGLRGDPAYIVLDGEDYEIQQVDAPGIPDAELNQALRFRLRDVSSVPVSDMAVAGQRQYANRRQQPDRLALAMVARRSRVQELVDLVAYADLEPRAVLGRETVLHDVATHVPGSGHPMLMVHLGEDDTVMTFSRAGQLVLARSQGVGLRRLREEGDEAVQALLRELQRTLDYHDSQLSQQPIDRILMVPAGGQAELGELLEQLSQSLPVPVARLQLQQVLETQVDGATRLDDATQGHCLLAAGAALPRASQSDVSLYQPPVRQFDPLAPASIIGYAAAAAVLLGVVSLVQGRVLSGAEDRLAEVEAEQEALLEQVQALEQEVEEARAPSEALVERRDTLEAQLGTQRQFLEELRGIHPEAMAGFSETLEGVGRQEQEALWLTRMHFSPQAGEFQGYALDAAEVTQFFEHLGMQREFQGWSFDHLALDRVTGRNGEAAGMRAYRFDAAAQRGGEP